MIPLYATILPFSVILRRRIKPEVAEWSFSELVPRRAHLCCAAMPRVCGTMLVKRWGNAALMLVCKRSPRTSRRTTLSRHAPQYRGPASVQQLRRQPRRSSTCEVCAWGGLSAAGICTRDAMHAYGEPKRHARTRASVCVCPSSAAPAPLAGARLPNTVEKFLRGRGYNTRKMYLRGSFRASHGAQVLRVCAPCLAAYEPSPPHPPQNRRAHSGSPCWF